MRPLRQRAPAKPVAAFSVVAEEVRNLAQRSTEAATSIRDLIDASQQSVEAGAALFSQTDDALTAIAESAVATRENVEQITEATRAQAVRAQDIVGIVETIATITGQNEEISEYNGEMADKISAHSASLKTKIDEFVVSAPEDVGAGRDCRRAITRLLTPPNYGVPNSMTIGAPLEALLAKFFAPAAFIAVAGASTAIGYSFASNGDPGAAPWAFGTSPNAADPADVFATVVFASATLASLFAGAWACWVVRTVNPLSNFADALADGRLSETFKATKQGDEIGRLAEALDRLSDDLAGQSLCAEQLPIP